MTTGFAIVLVLGIVGLLVLMAAVDRAVRALRCSWSGHDWFIAYPSGAAGSRISKCSRCERQVRSC